MEIWYKFSVRFLNKFFMVVILEMNITSSIAGNIIKKA